MDPEAAQTSVSQPSKTKKPILVLVVLLFIGVLGVGGFLVYEKLFPKTLKTEVVTGLERDLITIGSVQRDVDIFPGSDTNFYTVVFNNHIFDGLTRIIGGQVKPALAKSWTNPDKNTWRFNLQKAVKFHNGDPFTASDVKFSIDTSKSAEWPNAFNLGTIDSVEVVDDFTVDIKTAAPDPILINRLVFAFIVSEKQYKNRGEEEAVGTGPYKLVKKDQDESIIEANNDYFLGKPKIKRVIEKFYPEDTKDEGLLQKLRAGEVDLVRLNDPKLARSVKSSFQVKALADPFVSFLWLDTDRAKTPYVDKDSNPFKNKLVRQALYEGININNIIKQASISARPASQLVTEAIFGYNPDIKRPEPNLEKAKSLMKEAGLENGFNLVLDTIPGAEKESEALIKELERINIKATANPVGDEEFYEKLLVQKDTSAYIIDYGAETFDAGEMFVNVLHTPNETFGADNLTNYSNPDIDVLAEEIATIFDSKTRKAKLQKAMVKAMEELPMIPFYSRELFYIVRNDFDWTPTAFGAVYANEISGRQIVVK